MGEEDHPGGRDWIEEGQYAQQNYSIADKREEAIPELEGAG